LVYALQNDNKGAEKHFQRSVDINPKYADGWMELGVVTYFQGRHEEALVFLKKAVKIKSRSKTIWYNIGRVYDVLEKQEDAIRAYRKALSYDKQDAKIWANMAGTYIALDRNDQGIQAAKRALELDPSDHIAKTNLATVLQDEGHLEEYETLVEDLINNHGDKTEVLQSLAHNKSLRNDFNGAFGLYQRIVDQNGVNPFNIQGLSLTYSNLEYHSDLIPILEKHVEYYTDDLHGRLLMGQAYLNASRFEEAIPHLEYYLEKEKSVPEAFTKLSACFANLQKIPEALAILEEAFTLFPDDADINFNLGLSKSLVGQSDFDQYFENSLRSKFNSHFLSIWMQAKAKSGNLSEEWMTEITEQLSEKTSLSNLYLTFGYAMMRLDQNEVAINFFELSLEADPSIDEVYEIALQLMELQKFERTVELFKRVVMEKPSVGSYNNLGVSYLRLNQIDEALQYLIEGHEKFPDDDFLLSNISKIYISLKNYQDAIPFYEKLLLSDQLNYVTIYEYATCLALTGVAAEAQRQYNHALQLAEQADDQEMIAKIHEMLGHLT
jgi:tetratricopeptide (TPR) repeat protein